MLLQDRERDIQARIDAVTAREVAAQVRELNVSERDAAWEQRVHAAETRAQNALSEGRKSVESEFAGANAELRARRAAFEVRQPLAVALLGIIALLVLIHSKQISVLDLLATPRNNQSIMTGAYPEVTRPMSQEISHYYPQVSRIASIARIGNLAN